jgi:serine/threonine-protein kinase
MLLNESTETLPLPGEVRETRKLRIPVEDRLRSNSIIAGRFRLVRHLATGGMSEVHEAFDQLLHVSVGIKSLRTDVEAGGHPDQLRREVRLARRVSHPNVLRVLEFFPADETTPPFLTMELLEGRTLASWLAQAGRLSPVEALPILEQVAAGLTAIHAQEVLHLDLKASNIFLSRQLRRPWETRVVVADFGVARAVDDGLDDDAKSPVEIRIGSPHYMAPEQLTGERIDPRADIYSLGVVLFQMVTGELPFSGETPLEAAMRRLQEAAPHARSRVSSLPRSWDRVIRDCLERDRERRPRTAEELVARLREDVKEEPRRSGARVSRTVYTTRRAIRTPSARAS